MHYKLLSVTEFLCLTHWLVKHLNSVVDNDTCNKPPYSV